MISAISFIQSVGLLKMTNVGLISSENVEKRDPK